MKKKKEERWKKKLKSAKKNIKSEKKMHCGLQCNWVWGNSDFPTPFSFMYNF
jgi:transposase